MDSKIKNLLNSNNWQKIHQLIIKGKLNPNEKIINGSNIIHIASINNKRKIIEYLLNKNIRFFESGDLEGNTPTHLLALYGNIPLLKGILKKNNKLINLINNKNETILHILWNDYDFLEWMLNNVDGSNKEINKLDKNLKTIIQKNIDAMPSVSPSAEVSNGYSNEINNKIIKLLLDHGADLFIPKDHPPLCQTIKNKDYDLTKLLIEYGADVNINDIYLMSPLLYAIDSEYLKIVKLLIDKGADINYCGPNCDYNPLYICINHNSVDILDYLLNKGYDVNKQNKKLEIGLHYSLEKKNVLPIIIAKLLWYSDINIQNIKGQTPLHYLIIYNNWENYTKILNHKNIDIFIEDLYKKRPVDYLIRRDNYYEFIDKLLLKNYVKQIDKTFMKKLTNICKKTKEKNMCNNILKKYIFETKRSVPNYMDYKIIKNKLRDITGNKFAKFGLFNSDTLHNLIYSLEILKKYPNLLVPFQFYNSNKLMNDKILFMNNLLEQDDLIISDLVKIYTNYFFELSPYVILWKSETVNYINKDIDFLIKKSLFSNKVRYIYIKLTIIISSNSHSNILLFDKVTGQLERFDPSGVIPYKNIGLLDEFLKKTLSKSLHPYYKEFLTPQDLYKKIGLQTLSNDDKIETKKLGDPIRYCLAWGFWYLEMRINNPEMTSEQIIEQIIDYLINSTSQIQRDQLFISYIRSYAKKLDLLKNNFMLRAGINPNNIYNLVLSIKDQRKIIKQLSKEFTTIINSRI